MGAYPDKPIIVYCGFRAYPGIPTLKELGCQDVPPGYYMVIGPKGMPADISKKLVEAFQKATESPDFQKMLATNNLPTNSRTRASWINSIQD